MHGRLHETGTKSEPSRLGPERLRDADPRRRMCAAVRRLVNGDAEVEFPTSAPNAKYAPSRPGTPGGPQGPGPRAVRPAQPSPARGPLAHTGDMRRIIGTIVGAILAISLAFTAVGRIVATLKMFLIIGLIAIAVVIIVWLVARRPRRD